MNSEPVKAYRMTNTRQGLNINYYPLKRDGVRVQGFKGSSDQGETFYTLAPWNPRSLEPLRRKR